MLSVHNFALSHISAASASSMYEEGHRVKKIKRLPLNMLDAVRLFDKSSTVRAGFGDELVDAYVKLKHEDWRNYSSSISQWERETTLDC